MNQSSLGLRFLPVTYISPPWQKWVALRWSSGEPRALLGPFGAGRWNAGCGAPRIPDGTFQTAQDPWQGCAVISPASTPGGIWEPVPRGSGAAGSANKALTCFSARQLRVVRQETLCTVWPGHRQKQKGTERPSQQPGSHVHLCRTHVTENQTLARGTWHRMCMLQHLL